MTTIMSSPRATVSDAGFNELVTAHRAAILAYATRLAGGDVHRAEDAAQEVWIRAWNHRERLSAERGSVRGWLLRVTHNVVIDQHRTRSARATEVELATGLDQRATGDRCDDVLTSLTVRPVLDRLTKPHREIIVEVYFRDRTAAQAAATLRVPIGTVKSRLHHALRTLRDLVPAPTPCY